MMNKIPNKIYGNLKFSGYRAAKIQIAWLIESGPHADKCPIETQQNTKTKINKKEAHRELDYHLHPSLYHKLAGSGNLLGVKI